VKGRISASLHFYKFPEGSTPKNFPSPRPCAVEPDVRQSNPELLPHRLESRVGMRMDGMTLEVE